MRVETGDPGESEIVRRAVERSRRGDLEALHFLYVRYAPEVLSRAQGVVADDRRAEQVTQEVFSTLITRMQRYERHDGLFGPWLLGVVDSVAGRAASAGPAQVAEA